MHVCWDFDASSAQILRVIHWTSIEIVVQVHYYFVTILKHKSNAQLLI